MRTAHLRLPEPFRPGRQIGPIREDLLDAILELLLELLMVERTESDGQALRGAVRQAYSQVALDPTDQHAFPVGRAFAEGVGYPAELLARLPSDAVDVFAGVSNVAIFADVPPGATVLDLGCGAGLDTLIAAERVGSSGTVYAVDFSEAMLARAQAAGAAMQLTNVRFVHAGAETLPLAEASIDVALVNGIFNLHPARDAIFHELARVMRPGGAVYAAELILREPLSDEDRAAVANWFA